MPLPPANASESQRQFGNADSFAMAFDEAWRHHVSEPGAQALSRVEQLDRVLAQLADHPFAQKDPTTAREVGEFRLRLLGL